MPVKKNSIWKFRKIGNDIEGKNKEHQGWCFYT